MREYESIFVLDPQVDDSQVDVELAKIQEIIQSGAGEITEIQKWGRRKLAYEIRKRKEGIYTLFRFKASNEVLAEINRRYRLNESLLRHLTVVYEGPYVGEGEPLGEGEDEGEGRGHRDDDRGGYRSRGRGPGHRDRRRDDDDESEE